VDRVKLKKLFRRVLSRIKIRNGVLYITDIDYRSIQTRLNRKGIFPSHQNVSKFVRESIIELNAELLKKKMESINYGS